MAQFVKATPSAELVNSILAVLHPPEEDLEGDHRSGANASGTAAAGPGDELTRLLNTNVAGFVTVVQLSLEEDSMTVLSPCPGALPSKYLLLGSLKWVE
jgi:polyribonucleotide 5'-hydroxyl-kinase